MSRCVIRPMKKGDIPVLAQIEKESFSEPWSEKGLESELLNENAVFLVAEKGSIVCGYIGCHTVLDEAYIANLAVGMQYRRNGIGEALTAFCEETVRKKGCSFISLEVRVSNKKAIALYEKRGFERLGERKNFYCSPTENALIMTKYF